MQRTKPPTIIPPITLKKPKAAKKGESKTPAKPERRLSLQERKRQEAMERRSHIQEGCVHNPDGSVSWYPPKEPKCKAEFLNDDHSIFRIGDKDYFIGPDAPKDPPYTPPELRECPLCGSHNVGLEEGFMNHVVCGVCGCSSGGFKQPWWAVRAWNTRPSDKTKIDLSAGFKVFDDLFAFCDMVQDGVIAVKKRKYTRRQPHDIEGWEQVEFSFMENV